MPGITAWAAKNRWRKIHGDPIVPVLDGHVLYPVPLVVSCVVEEDIHIPDRSREPADGVLDGRDIAQVCFKNIGLECPASATFAISSSEASG